MSRMTWLLLSVLPLVCMPAWSDQETKPAGAEAKLVLTAPDPKDEVGFASWDAAATGGQPPSWAYLITLREKSPKEAHIHFTSWVGNASFANAIYFFNFGSLTKKIEVPWRPSSIADWSGPDEKVHLSIGAGGEHITYWHTVSGPLIKGNRKPAVVEAKIYDRNGAQVKEDLRFPGVASLSGRFLSGPRSFWDLGSGTPFRTGGDPLFSSYDDSFVVYHPGQGSIEFYDVTGQKRWNAEIASGPLRLAVVSPDGRYVVAVAGAGEHRDVAAVVDAKGRILWKTTLSEGSYAAAFSNDARHVALVTRDANAIHDTETGKVLAKASMAELFPDEKLSPHSSKIYVSSDKPRATVIAGMLRLDGDIGGKLPPVINDVVYEFGVDRTQVHLRLPPRTFILAAGGIGYSPAATLSPDGHWLYYVSDKGLLARRLE